MSKALSRRTLLQWLAGSLLIVGNRAVAGAFFLPKPGLQKVKGTVRINGKAAVVGQLVSWGDEVSTGADGEAVFTLDRDAYLLRANSKVTLGVAAAEQFIKLHSGKMLSVFGPGPKTISTQAVTLGIRGTGCYLEAHGQRSYFCLCYGHVVLAPTADPRKAIEYSTVYHDQPYWIDGKIIVPTKDVINHTDAELIMLEALQNRRPPFAQEQRIGGGGY
ncbi:FecR domain-containing protein [Chitinilyticum litopenaei]|uniref:FecR domain-containing protein n=1 Tax=Chitinilyticum litopenaei TaxID=1121276 RepID=UPI0003F56832|nr:FecR domain-containing protein [Chitinilyticum litopenaei]